MNSQKQAFINYEVFNNDKKNFIFLEKKKIQSGYNHISYILLHYNNFYDGK
ncbi:hypothetical protein rsdtw13_35420 [Clostridium sp. TW13]|uniref:Uncharacterized protein n=1 Tax=Inconstantimicrobium mannanitabidum TaxID=1604901 RepID=A0ACB5RGS9_9CLOT|nr:hypothetical protein rsdtw13_35420 [Clostridium sp. TW13]